MSSPVITISEEKTAMDAAKLLKRKRRGFLVVTRRGKPVGVISDKDLIFKVLLKNLKADKVKIKKIMTKHFVYSSPEEDIKTAADKMLRNNVHRMPVIKKGRVVGVISLTDIARTSPAMLELLEYRRKMKTQPIVIREKYTSGICDICGNYSDRLEYVNGQWICESCKETEEE